MTDTISFTPELKKAIQIAQSIAKEFSNDRFSPAHLLKAILHKDAGLVKWLSQRNKDIYFMEEWAEVRIESYPKSSKVADNPSGDEKVAGIFEEADNLRLKLGKDEVDPLCILAALSTPGIAFTYDQLKTFPVTQQEILQDAVEQSNIQQAVSPGQVNGSSKTSPKSNALLQYCIDKTALARQGKLDPIIGRDRETRMVAEILGRRSKPNVIIVGEPGVGKTALVDGFAQNIINGKVPGNLKNAIIFELDFGALIAGASYKGEVEDRLKNIVREIKEYEKAILFIDEIHTLIDKNGGAAGAANLLKPELARGEITIIGATTNDEYRKFIEPDEAFNRRFEILKVEEPDERTAVRMIEMLLPHYENHHNLKAGEDLVAETVRLSKRYIKDRRLPDAAIDLIDRTMSVVRMMGETSKEEIENLVSSLSTVQENISTGNMDAVKELRWFFSQLKDKVSHVLFAQMEDQRDVEKIDSSEELTEYLNKIISRLGELAGTKKDIVEKGDVAAVVSHKTGIPLGKLQTREKDRLMNMEEILKQRVVGQDHAIKSVAEAILESRSGLSKPGQPIGSFFLLGPTGTGKTELAKSLAEFLFMDESSLIRFDMSEFKEEHSAALLYGAPPGYVGYEEGGLLVNKIRQQPYAVVLFDEIEKAHPSVFDLFLQILDEGKLHDRLGKEGDFSNAVILFTSNIGSQYVVEKFDKGEIPGTNELMDIMSKHFRPEFLGRLTEIVPFAPISGKNVVRIFDIHLNGLLKTLEKQQIMLKLTDEAKEFLAKSGFTPKYGARPLTGVIRNQLRRPLSKMIITGELGKGDMITLSLKGSELEWKKGKQKSKSTENKSK